MTDPDILSAFPTRPGDPDQLPEIPGGWKEESVDLRIQTLKLAMPRDPDVFLDDATVHEENAKHDYMPYWAFLWPSSIPMASAVLKAAWPEKTEVLELGAGIGLVGLAAASRGFNVTYSDYDETALHLCRYNTRLNGFQDPETMFLDWRACPDRKFPVLLGCEVTYDATLHEPLLDAVKKLMSPGGICWLGDPGRFQAPTFYKKALAAGFNVRLLNADLNPISDVQSNNFQIMELSLTEKA